MPHNFAFTPSNITKLPTDSGEDDHLLQRDSVFVQRLFANLSCF